jgi:DNA transformation protein and related proteins
VESWPPEKRTRAVVCMNGLSRTASLAKLVLKVTIHGMAADKDFANYCCELLASAGPCVPKRMFGGYGISTDGLTIAIIADLGAGEKLWLKGDDGTRSQYEAVGCARFVYDTHKDGVPRSMSMNYFSAPEAAMDSADAMRPWAALALTCAVRANASKRKPRQCNKALGKRLPLKRPSCRPPFCSVRKRWQKSLRCLKTCLPPLPRKRQLKR